MTIRNRYNCQKNFKSGAVLNRWLLCSAAAIAFAAPLAGEALAQTAAAPAPESTSVLMEEITVTAQKREQGAQTVGISITAISGDQMRAMGLTNAQEVTAMAAGVSTLQPNGEANYAIGVRGVGNNDFTTNVESPVAIYVDEVYISQMSGAGFLLFDVDRVELLRGPQGTLFGRNATGGLVHYLTVKPSDKLNGYGSITYGRFNDFKVQGAVNVPLSDKVMIRVSAATNQADGYVTNLLMPEQKLNNANESAGRFQMLLKPAEDLDILLNARFGRQDIRTGFYKYVSAAFPNGQATPGVPNPYFGGYVDNNPDVNVGSYDTPGHNRLRTAGYTGTIKLKKDFATLTSITDYQTTKRDYIEDSDASPVDYFQFFLTTDAKQFSQELRLNGEAEKLKWVGGFYYMDLKVGDSNGGITRGLFNALADAGVFGPDVHNINDLGANGVQNPYQTRTKTWSLFGQLEYAVTNQVALIGGFRWIDEKKSHDYRDIFMWFPNTSTSGVDPNATEIFDGVTPYHGSRHDKNWAARVQVNVTPAENTLLYLSWNRGVKSGGFNAPLLPSAFAATDALMNYSPEKLDAYEAGFKWDSANHKLRINGSAYYYNYKNYQAFSIIGLDTATLNAQDKTKGFELEMKTSPVTGLDMQLGVAYIDAKVTNVLGLTKGVDTNGDGIIDVPALLPGATVKPVQSPKWNLNGLVRYEFNLGEKGSLAFQADGVYRSKHYFALTNLPASTGNGYFVANASATWFEKDNKWSIRLFVQNLTDKKYLVQTFDLSGTVANGGLFGMIEQYYGRPRMWGANLSYSF
jgi:iron complex outermembrane receptor protein